MYNYRKEDVLPLSTITLEGESFSAPARVQSALEGVYGSLEAGAKCESATLPQVDCVRTIIVLTSPAVAFRQSEDGQVRGPAEGRQLDPGRLSMEGCGCGALSKSALCGFAQNEGWDLPLHGWNRSIGSWSASGGGPASGSPWPMRRSRRRRPTEGSVQLGQVAG